MQFISSDTSVWIDFSTIGFLQAPFLLNDQFTYMMVGDSIDAELLYPLALRTDLLKYGLHRTDLTEEEYQLAIRFTTIYPQLSAYDRFALSIAKVRKIILLTGDGRLRKAALQEKVEVHGTLWVVDQLWAKRRLQGEEYKTLLAQLENHCGKEVRLPLDEILKRIKELY